MSVAEKRYVCNMPDCHVVLPTYILYRKHNALHNQEDFGRKRRRSSSCSDGDDAGYVIDGISDSDGDSTCWGLNEESADADLCGICELFPSRNETGHLEKEIVWRAGGDAKRQRKDGSSEQNSFLCPEEGCGKSFTLVSRMPLVQG
jgi:hypothetical protein